MHLSFVIPALNEQDSIGQLYQELCDVMSSTEHSFELLFVDDGSTDDTAERMLELVGADARVRLIQFSKNRGKSDAYVAAFREASGEVVVTLDADLQDDPAELPKLLDALDTGADLVVGWKMHRLGNEPRKTLPSRVFNAMNRLFFGLSLRDQNSGYRAMRLPVARSLQLYGDQYRFIPQLARLQGFEVGEVGVLHRKRQFGVSKYGATRFWTGLLDLLTVRFLSGFATRPLHFFATLGVLPALVGAGLEAYVLAQKLTGGTFQEHVAALIVGVMCLLVGFQCVLLGLIGEMLTAHAARNREVPAALHRHPDADPTATAPATLGNTDAARPVLRSVPDPQV